MSQLLMKQILTSNQAKWFDISVFKFFNWKSHLSSIHSTFRLQSDFDRTGDVTALNHHIAINKKIMSIHKKLSYLFWIFKKRSHMISEKRIIEFTRINDCLLQGLTCYKNVHTAGYQVSHGNDGFACQIKKHWKKKNLFVLIIMSIRTNWVYISEWK